MREIEGVEQNRSGRILKKNQDDGRNPLPLRVTFLAVMPAPYMMDLFEAMDRDPRLRLQVLYLEKPAVAAPGVYWREQPLPRYASVLAGGWIWFARARVHLNIGLFEALAGSRPDVVVVLGYSSLTCQLAMYGLWIMRIPWIFWGEVPGFEHRGRLGSLLRWSALRPLALFARGVAGIGSRATAAYADVTHRANGKRRPLVWNIPYYCSTDAFLRIDRRAPTSRGRAPHFLYCGQIVPRKGVDMLVRSFCRLANDNPEVRLTLVGDGPLRADLAALVPGRLRERVLWAGFKEAAELPPYFAEANVFVLPSVHDGWGVVINQAISAGMAIVASDGVGAAADFVTEGVNGIIFPTQNEGALIEGLRFFAEQPEQIHAYGKASRERARELDPLLGADRWYQFCRAVLSKSRVPSATYQVTSCACF